MSHGRYSFETDPGHNYLRVNMAGDWDATLTAAFVKELERTIRGMIGAGAVYGKFRTLVDMREKNILPQDAAVEFGKIVRPDSPSCKIALVVSGMLHKLQTKRIGLTDKHRIFEWEDEALQWLRTDAA